MVILPLSGESTLGLDTKCNLSQSSIIDTIHNNVMTNDEEVGFLILKYAVFNSHPHTYQAGIGREDGKGRSRLMADRQFVIKY